MYRVVSDVDALHQVMRRCGAVLGGSAVVQMVCPIFDDVQDFDFYVPMASFEELVQHFVVGQGYRRCDEDTYVASNGCMRGDIRYLCGITKRVQLELGECRVDVIGVGIGDDWDFVLTPIASSWTTLLFNYATADWVVVGYPGLTMRGRALLQCERVMHPSFPGGTRLQELEKYQARGFEFQPHVEDWDVDARGRRRPCRRGWVCPLMFRSFNDGGCLRVAVGQGNGTVPAVQWRFGGTACPSACDHPEGRKACAEVHVAWCVCY
ncbi:hypothetical protein OH76DRAFT_1414569 [Lentinus brumalis]|uniref:Uncharacterized protein n=1 Tax=Lentinus brumalis TaxID=2498619 RepID=A0A371DUA6_9APHY|nr:hypothetical protein OH76DRAFT_1414569 [Polyporus brumalis]